MSSYRPERVAGEIHRVISELLLSGNIKDPRVALVTLTEVQVTRDLGLARIYYTVLGDKAEKAEAAEGLQRAAAFVRRTLGQEIRLRHTPELRFEYDNSAETGRRIDELLRNTRSGSADVD